VDRSTKAADTIIAPNSRSGARHEGCLSKYRDGDTVDSDIAWASVGEELGLELGLDATDSTFTTKLSGSGDLIRCW
jgi:hypothetical protein